MRNTVSTSLKHLTGLIVFAGLMFSCSHKFDPDVLNLDFYQWNLWQDTGADPGDLLPSCGWEDFKRGKGKLVRIPAPLGEHFRQIEPDDVFWYHCRFTLPEKWEELPISLVFESASPIISVFLNEQDVGNFHSEDASFEADVSESIFYTRDNHLAIRISRVPGEGQGSASGITGTILVKPELNMDQDQNLSE